MLFLKKIKLQTHFLVMDVSASLPIRNIIKWRTKTFLSNFMQH